MALKFYWDACVCIDWIQDKDPAKRKLLQPIIAAATNKEVIICVSALVMAEVIRAAKDAPMTDEEDDRVRAFFLHPFIDPRPIDPRIAHMARGIIRERINKKAADDQAFKKIPLHDAIHIASALDCGCDCLHSFDADHLLKENRKHGLPGRPLLRIELPSYVPPAPPGGSSGQQNLGFG